MKIEDSDLHLRCLFSLRRFFTIPFAAKYTRTYLLMRTKRASALLCLLNLLLPSTLASQLQYTNARSIRINQGAAVAVPLYRELLVEYPLDCTTATHLAASESASDQLITVCTDHRKARELRQLLENCDYSTTRIQEALAVPSQHCHAACPIFVSPVAAGTVTQFPWGDKSPSALECLIALFLIGLVIPRETLEQAISNDGVTLLLDLGFLSSSGTDLLFSLIQIFPISLSPDKTLFIVTDWHPRVLSQTSINDTNDAVMYIGPDSLALVQHFLMADLTITKQQPELLLDVCTGSGIQALAGLLLNKCDHAVCVDVNHRCLRFTRFNAALNGLESRVDLICGDLVAGEGILWTEGTVSNVERRPLLDLIRQTSPTKSLDTITANPPFLPVPPTLPTSKHGLFSDGGSTGEIVLASIVELGSNLLSPTGVLAIVSEFFLEQPDSAEPLLSRIRHWFAGDQLKGVFLTNEYPIDAQTYAERRSDSEDEKKVWLDHLASQRLNFASPGLLYLQRNSSTNSYVAHITVPQSEFGSIWSPSNPKAITFTQRVVNKCFGREQK